MADPEQITNAPAPWDLQGNAYICFLHCPSDLLIHQSFLPDSLFELRQKNYLSLMMFVDYSQSPVGPYRELLFIPDRFLFEDGSQHLSISRIFVSSMESVIHGRKNWGMPKEMADFEIIKEQNLDRIVVKRQGKNIVELVFRSWPISVPFSTVFLPKAWRSFGQYDRGLTFIYYPKGSGLVRPAQLLETNINPDEFPPVNVKQSVGAIKITRFKLQFPRAKVMGSLSV